MPATRYVSHPCQNGRRSAVISGHLRAPQTIPDLSTGRLTPCLKRPSLKSVRRDTGHVRARCRDDGRSLTVNKGSSALRGLHVCNGTSCPVDQHQSSKRVMRFRLPSPALIRSGQVRGHNARMHCRAHLVSSARRARYVPAWFAVLAAVNSLPIPTAMRWSRSRVACW
jgi:hypothetical protein